MTATYRLQLHAGFTFADAQEVVPYLADLGVSHLYLSPVLQAVPGSMHGYDVLDHDRVSDELGGADGLERLAATARQHGLGLVVDVVPNHMALVAPESSNAPLWDVLAHGRDAAHAHWFDVDWEALDGKIGLPVLWEGLADVLAKGDLRLGEENGERVLRYHDHVFPVAPGTWDGDAGADVAEVLDRQHYLLAGWREKDDVLNYRRFFDIDGLVAVRVEEPDVFDATHRVLLDLNHRGIVEGFRIDHPDGLADPAGYVDRLRAALRPGTAIWVEKILEGDETLPPWACEGTTGYDAAKVVSAALLDPATAPALQDAWTATGGDPSLEHVVEESKREVVDHVLVPEHRRLVRRAHEALPDADPDRLAAAVAELLVACEVYRAYVGPDGTVDDLARERLTRAGDRAAAARPDLKPELEGLVGLATGPARRRRPRLRGPAPADLGAGDGQGHRGHRVLPLAPPGRPQRGRRGPGAARRGLRRRPARLGRAPAGALAARHDHPVHPRHQAQRGRAGPARGRGRRRGGVAALLRRVRRRGARSATSTPPPPTWCGRRSPGVGPVEEERVKGYLVKAMRESKQRTSWLDPDPEYEARVLALAADAGRPGELAALVRTAVDHNAEAVRAFVLGQKLLQLTLPGVPDTYQGCELVDLSLVDPDNRRPVDYDERRERLAHVQHDGPPRPVRREAAGHPRGAGAAARAAGELRRPVDLRTPPSAPPGTSSASSAAARSRCSRPGRRAGSRRSAAGATRRSRCPEGLWRDELTGVLHGGEVNRCADVLADYPVALLRKVHMR